MTNHPPRVLIIATSAATMGSSDEPTGLWLEELTTPYYAFADAGAQITLASIKGGAIPIDARSLTDDATEAESVQRYQKDEDFQRLVADTPAFDTIAADAFDAVFLPGGHGTMFDYPGNAALATMLADAHAGGKVVAAVCHGPAGLVDVMTADGTPLVKGKRVAGFTDSEERAVGLADKVPFLLETRLRALGADYQKGPDFQPFAVTDGRLVTGQNPQSAAKVADGVLAALKTLA